MKTNLLPIKALTLAAGISLLAITSTFAQTDVTETAEDSILAPGAGNGPGICNQVCDATGQGKAAANRKGRKGNKGGNGGNITQGRGDNCGNFAQGAKGGNGGRQSMRQGRGNGRGQQNADCILNTPVTETTPEA